MSQFIMILTLPEIVGIITLAGALIVVSIVIFLIVNSTQSENQGLIKAKFDKIRGRYFWGLSIILILIFFVSLKFLPYSRFQGKADEVVTVVGIQWDWRMVNGISNKTPAEFLGKNEIYLPVNKRIKFIITSDDVTHDFAIYNSRGILLTQTQAMPQYRNELKYVFTQKGKYTVLCLEYCGLVHPFMTGTIYVR